MLAVLAQVMLKKCESRQADCSVLHNRLHRTGRGKCRECSSSTKRGEGMPAFTFEKIPPPGRAGQTNSIEKKQRSAIVQILDRFVETRIKRSSCDEENAAIPPASQVPPI